MPETVVYVGFPDPEDATKMVPIMTPNEHTGELESVDTFKVRCNGALRAELPFGVPVTIYDDSVVTFALSRTFYLDPEGLNNALLSDDPTTKALAVNYLPKQHYFVKRLSDLNDPRFKAVVANSALTVVEQKAKDYRNWLEKYDQEHASLESTSMAVAKEVEQKVVPKLAKEAKGRDAASFAAYIIRTGQVNQELMTKKSLAVVE